MMVYIIMIVNKKFITLAPGADVTKLFVAVSYQFLQEARVFVPSKLFQPCIIFPGKAGSTFHLLLTRVGSRPFPQALD